MLRALIAGFVFLPFVALAANQVQIKIEGMSCEACVKSVKANLEKIPNVDQASVKVILKEKTATLSVKSADAATLESIKKAVTDAGYKVAGDVNVN